MKEKQTYRCNDCGGHFSIKLLPATGTHKCPECYKAYKRKQAKQHYRKKKREQESYWDWAGTGYGIYF